MYEPILNERQTKVDWLMILAVLGLMMVGAAFIYSATSVSESGNTVWYKQNHIKQIFYYGLGSLMAGVICLVNYHVLARWALIAYWGTVALLVFVLIFGREIGGARRWIDFPMFQLQPSELAKLAVILVLGNYLSRPVDELRSSRVFFGGLALIGLPFLLILKEPDLGSALVLIPIGLTMMYVARVPVVYLRRLVVGASVLIILLLIDVLFAPPYWRIKLEEYQTYRLKVYFGLDFAPANATPAERKKYKELERKSSYNVEQALISVGSGGLTGKGWCQGKQYALGFLPRSVAHNDFIFSVIAEEKGFLGSLFVIFLYTMLLFTGLRIAGQARDRLGKLLAVGVVALFFSHVFVNIGMNIRLMPVTGIPLPLLSYGGSSVLSSLMAVGILQNVYIYRKSY